MWILVVCIRLIELLINTSIIDILSVELDATHISSGVSLSAYIIVWLLASIWVLLPYILTPSLAKSDRCALVVQLRYHMYTIVILREIGIGRGARLETQRICWLFMWRWETVLFVYVRENCSTCIAICLLLIVDIWVIWKAGSKLDVGGIHLKGLWRHELLLLLLRLFNWLHLS